MPDRDKVIKGLEHCADRTQKRCNKTCPYHGRDFCESELAADALALVNDKEMVKPKKIKAFSIPACVYYSFICDNCKSDLISGQPYCAGCGRKVKWE